jgi:PKD repeat protein
MQFDGSESNAPGGTIVHYLWEFGDDTTAEGAQTEHLYDYLDFFTVVLTVTDDSGASSSCSTIAEVMCVADAWPYCYIEPGSIVIEAGEEVEFDGSDSHPACLEGTIVDFHWDFGDGTTARGPQLRVVAHTYSEPDDHLVRLTVYDDQHWAGSCVSWVRVTTPVERSSWGAIKSLYQ